VIEGLPYASNLYGATIQVPHGTADGFASAWIDVCRALSFRLLGKITGKDAGSVGTLNVKLYGKVREVEYLITTMNIVAAGVAIVLNTSLQDIRGYEEVQVRLSYSNAPGDYVNLTLIGSYALEC